MSKTDELDRELRPVLEELYRQNGSPADPIACMILGVRFGAALALYEPSADEPQPVKNPDGSIENFTVRLTNGRFYHCECGCNVFHKPDDGNLNLYRCNACENAFEAE